MSAKVLRCRRVLAAFGLAAGLMAGPVADNILVLAEQGRYRAALRAVAGLDRDFASKAPGPDWSVVNAVRQAPPTVAELARQLAGYERSVEQREWARAAGFMLAAQNILSRMERLQPPEIRLQQAKEEAAQRPSVMAQHAVAVAAFEARQWDEALAAATATAQEARQGRQSSLNGVFLQRSRTVEGMVLLQRGDVAGAKAKLAQSVAEVPQGGLEPLGPSLVLARALLEKGERAAVLEFLQSVRASGWKLGERWLPGWIDTVQKLGTPDFGPFGQRL